MAFASVCLVTGVAPERAPARVPLLERVAAALADQPGFPFELIVVDNGQTADHAAAVNRIFASIPNVTHLVRNRHNRWLGGGMRQAFALASGAYLVNVNDDVLVRPGWLAVLLAPLLACPDDKLIGALGRFESVGKRLGTAMFAGRKYTFWSRASGCLWAQRRETYERFGPALSSQRWDTYYASRVRHAGYRFVAPTQGAEPAFASLGAAPRRLPPSSADVVDFARRTASYVEYLDGGVEFSDVDALIMPSQGLRTCDGRHDDADRPV